MNTLLFEAKLAKEYKYQKLPPVISNLCRETYLKNIPASLSLNGGGPIYTLCGTLITSHYNRIVIGDYGAFIEFDTPNYNQLITSIGEEYRSNSDWKNCKYEWLTMKDRSDIKIYYQKHTVDYADYKIGKYYVSVHEVIAGKE